jgi:hypothetical protein
MRWSIVNIVAGAPVQGAHFAKLMGQPLPMVAAISAFKELSQISHGKK